MEENHGCPGGCAGSTSPAAPTPCSSACHARPPIPPTSWRNWCAERWRGLRSWGSSRARPTTSQRSASWRPRSHRTLPSARRARRLMLAAWPPVSRAATTRTCATRPACAATRGWTARLHCSLSHHAGASHAGLARAFALGPRSGRKRLRVAVIESGMAAVSRVNEFLSGHNSPRQGLSEPAYLGHIIKAHTQSEGDGDRRCKLTNRESHGADARQLRRVRLGQLPLHGLHQQPDLQCGSGGPPSSACSGARVTRCLACHWWGG
jgi:hypothetical protein